MRFLFAFFMGFVFIAQNAFGAGCTLEFDNGLKTPKESVYTGWWIHHLDDSWSVVRLLDEKGGWVPIKDLFAYDSLDKLKFVDGQSVTVPKVDREAVGSVYFKCDKWANGKYFAFDCYSNGRNVVGNYDGENVFDECIKPTGDTKPSDLGSKSSDCGNVGQRECDGRYWVCNSNADCGTGYLPSRATAGHCVSAGRNGYKVCTATKCEDGYELARDKNGNSQGWCQKKTERSDATKVSTGGAGQDEQGQTVNGDVADGVIVPGNPDQGQDKHVKSTDGDEAQKSAFDFSKLDKMLDKHFVSRYSDVWKNSDGNFNTARLASDSIAGVVLGTTGGVITSKIVKKNQIKSGFESLKCTIAGQDVATYGDDFTVGVN